MPTTKNESPLPDLRPRLATMGRYLRLRDGLRLVARTLWLAMLVVVLVELAARTWPMANRHLWALVPLGVCLLGVLLYTWLRPLSLYAVARRLDAELHLKDRLATALELQDSDRPDPLAFYPRQLADAAAVARQLKPGALDWQVSRQKLGWAAAVATVALALVFLPNPMDAILAHRAAVQAAAQQQAEAIRAARNELESATDPTSEERAQALAELERLMAALAANPGDLDQALADLAKTQAQLRELQSPAATARQSALDQLAAQLTALSQGESQASTDTTEAGQALQELAASLPGLDPSAQTDLADTLDRLAAQTAAADADLAKSLVDLANAVRNGSAGEALQAAGAAQGALAQASQNADLQEALAQAQNALNDSRQQLAQSGQAQSQGQAQAQTSGQGQGQGQNQQGQGQGQGSGQPGGGGGTTANQLPGANRTGRANDPTQPNRPAVTGQLDTIYAPNAGPHLNGNPDFVAGQETEQGQTLIREEQSPQGN
ncbi:MAG TPA: hypothetical protein P5526_02260, partial [Anaerolineae bacterium]|nr:hypothetical protein [Anaerolineae bacterium]